MGNRFFTILVIPERSSQVKRVVIPTSFLKGVVYVAGGLCILLAFMVYQYLDYRGKIRSYYEAVRRNDYLERQMQAVQTKIGTIESTLQRARQFEMKLRIITGLEDHAERHLGIGPISEFEQGRSDARNDEGEAFNQARIAALDRPASFGSGSGDMEFRRIHGILNDLQADSALQEQRLEDLRSMLEERSSLLASTPSVMPTSGWITSRFGFRISPFTSDRKMHEGLDIANKEGTLVYSPAEGIVTYVGQWASYGNVVVIDHGYGLLTRYGHNRDVFVKVRQKVRRGDKISAVGSTGRSTGPHLHYEVRVNGLPVDPQNYILDSAVASSY